MCAFPKKTSAFAFIFEYHQSCLFAGHNFAGAHKLPGCNEAPFVGSTSGAEMLGCLERNEIAMAAPTMTPEQRAAALEKARVVRAQRSEITQKLSMGITTPAEVLEKVSDPVIGRMKVKAFVGALPGYGKVKTEKLMEELGIPADRRLQGLGSNQMKNLLEALS